ncbi:TetR/AcrR family transcriptional regulator [Mycobacterium koreense]|uniref:TetR family transcriptional regulator n=1 Tax=Mycolicibacillus koreensis TaxID=1069220 RepID=A0A7I7SKC1_9MYCO|nr:TetR/AcrR family transcriptional regulator [Mycolicibacillus koreensis]MCV7247266.1 TetR/AcrR family transcriptional regulator [Mycolicibacillus koreensis]ODR06687.1 TetR family transcriptional regulator [Mycolicibacillus koreensis]OSC34216.1 TetR family transcriptional regulator [Mycolicibacillus koreensis]BBY56455.1 TetR family transcriptional regulator [Mycolicibacillus koreensis]
MRTHGWGGDTPADDQEAIARILAAADAVIDVRGADISIADVARTLGVTRQTVYRYFPSTEAVLTAAGTRAAHDFLDRLAAHVAGRTDPADAAVEAVATVLEWLPDEPHVTALLARDRGNVFIARMTSTEALGLAESVLRRFDVDWAAHGFGDADLAELAEHLLRTIASFIIDPGRPARRPAALRAYLHRWAAAALTR